METLGLWILFTFGFYYVIALLTGSKHVIGSLALGAVLSLGVVLAFF